MMLPRIRGRTARIESTDKDNGKWLYEMSLWQLSGETRIGEPFLFGPFENEEVAKTEGKKIVQFACEEIEKDITGGTISGRYLDLKNGGVMRPWKEHS